MKRFIVFAFFLFSVFYLSAQDISAEGKYPIHKHETYIVSYNVQMQNPDFVIWRLTDKEASAAEASKIERPKVFTAVKILKNMNLTKVQVMTEATCAHVTIEIGISIIQKILLGCVTSALKPIS